MSIFVIRVNSEGRISNSRPCINCLNYMKLFGIKSVYYSTDDETIETEKIKTMETTHYSVAHKRFLGILPHAEIKKSEHRGIIDIFKKLKY